MLKISIPPSKVFSHGTLNFCGLNTCEIYVFSTVSTHIKLHSWLNHQYSKIWINLHFFGPKVHFLRLFEAFMGKNFNKPPPWNPHILINRQCFICVGKVCNLVKSQIRYFYKSPRLWRLGKVGKSDPTQHKV